MVTVRSRSGHDLAYTLPRPGAGALLGPGEAAKILKISVRHLARIATAGDLSTLRTVGGARRYVRAEVESMADPRKRRERCGRDLHPMTEGHPNVLIKQNSRRECRACRALREQGYAAREKGVRRHVANPVPFYDPDTDEL